MTTDIALRQAADKVGNMGPDEQESVLLRLLAQSATNPADIGFPASLPMELALKFDTPQNVCTAYGIDREKFGRIIKHPVFIKAYQEACELLKLEGMSFKAKAKLQAEDYLATAHNMVKNPNISDSVRADLIKNTVRWAGYDAKAADVGASGSNFNIMINLS